jgi:VWFA-related protein
VFPIRLLTRAALAAVAICAIATTPQAQSPQSPTSSPTFRSGVDLVRLDIRVTDALGRPITDLRPEELIITDGSETRPPVLFQRITEPADTFVDAALEAMSAEVSSNAGFPRGHLYVLIFDQTHIAGGNEQRARMAAEQFIRTKVRPTDRVAIFAVPGPGPRVGFTNDRTRAIEALSSVRGSYQRTVQTPFGTMPIYDAHRIAQGDEKLTMDTIDRFIREGTGDLLGLSNTTGVGGRGAGAGASEETAVARRLLLENARTIIQQTDAESRQFLQRLVDVINSLADIEGRKSVVLFSEGFFSDNLSRELEAVAAAAAQTYAVFYSFDLNQRTASITEAYASDTMLGSEVQARIAPLGSLAAETDGQLVIDAASRTTDALLQLASAAQDYYLVGFEPSVTSRNQPGKYQRVQVRVTRPGARVSTRTGYAVRATATAESRQRALANGLGSPFVQQGLKVDYTTYLLKSDTPGQQRIVMSLQAQVPAQRTTEMADIVFVARDLRDGRVAASGADRVAVPVPTGGATTAAISWRAQFTLPAGAYQMRAVVREPSGLMGSADRRLDVRALDTAEVGVSDLVLGRSATNIAVQAVAFVDDGVSGLIETYARQTSQLDGLRLQLAVRTPDGRTTVASHEQALTPPATDPAGAVSRSPFTIPLPGVTPGAYLVTASIRSASGALAERTRRVEIVAGSSGAVGSDVSFFSAPPPITASAIVEGQLGQAYLSAILGATVNTKWSAAAEDAARGSWERVEAAIVGAAPAATDFAAHALLGLARLTRDDFAGAAAALTAARTADEDSALTLFFLGWAQDFGGDTRAALTSWRGAAFLEPTMVSAHLALAEGYVKLKEPALAVQAIRAGLAVVPESPELRLRLQQLEGGR